MSDIYHAMKELDEEIVEMSDRSCKEFNEKSDRYLVEYGYWSILPMSAIAVFLYLGYRLAWEITKGELGLI